MCESECGHVQVCEEEGDSLLMSIKNVPIKPQY